MTGDQGEHMHLFRDAQAPYLAHFRAAHHGDHTDLFWETRNTQPLNWRVLRSDVEFAETAEALPGGRQTVVMQGTDTRLSDRDVGDSDHHYYTVFAQNEDGVWQRQAEIRIAPHEHFFWHHPDAERQHDADSDLQAGVRSGELVGQARMLGLRESPGPDVWLST
jgi:hypothetical protein